MIYEVLKKCNISYEEECHEKVFTVEEAEKLSLSIDGVGCKNLFLKDEKGHFYLVFMKDQKRANLTNIALPSPIQMPDKILLLKYVNIVIN